MVFNGSIYMYYSLKNKVPASWVLKSYLAYNQGNTSRKKSISEISYESVMNSYEFDSKTFKGSSSVNMTSCESFKEQNVTKPRDLFFALKYKRIPG
jgi:hypothetical protein